MYTANTVEGYHRQLRKVTKTKGAFSSDVASQKLVYLTIQNLQIRWGTTTYNWKELINQCSNIFDDRIKLHRFDQAPLTQFSEHSLIERKKPVSSPFSPV